MATKEEITRLKCEKVLNEDWALAIEYYDELKKIVEQGGPRNKRERDVIFIVAIVALSKMTMDKATDEMYLS